MADYSIWMLEYSHCLTQPMGCIFYGQWNAGTRPFPYSYVYVEGEGHKILVDVGHDDDGTNRVLSERYDVIDWQPPAEVLGKIGVRPEEIDTVVFTHVHYDHAGAARRFPNARFYLQRKDLEGAQWALENRRLFESIIGAIDPSDVEMLVGLEREGRLELLDGDLELFPGFEIKLAEDTHTFGSQYVVVRAGDEPWVITGDNLYSYENAEGIDQSGVPVSIGFGGGSCWNTLSAIDEMHRTAIDSNRLVIAHEGATFDRHPSRLYDDRLSVAELTLAPGVASRITTPSSAQPSTTFSTRS
ncbi:N-acyl homoserine lactonase family protein [Tessaracoccus oleiagri]|uniref:Glyoxylase, beta-lactamase superfamily II n=1 Tax=Tessaracoccus oleiagri TaxID=686624 RepID=A0A1G9HLB4_9ACTN|nr:N-acyl homoserine lactonase family protein [Tessaracoccus oleiagri]SDL13747.1 Glyoxylase, beta-lactamase superfamily II [Tessaracoccus oleiagri]